MQSEMVKIQSVNKVFSVNWALTNKCNYQCEYCHPDLHNGSIRTPKLEDAIKFVDKVFKHTELKGQLPYFEFGGGEVTLLKYFSKLLEYVHGKGGRTSVISNGSKRVEWWKENAKYMDGVNLSYHVNDIKNSLHFINVARALENSPNTRLNVNIMMYPERFSECLLFANKLKEKVRCSINLQPLYHGFGSAKIEGMHNYSAFQMEVMNIFKGRDDGKKLHESRALLNVEHIDGSRRQLSTDFLKNNNLNNFLGWECYVGVESVVVRFSGEVLRAWCYDKVIGSIYDDDFDLPNNPIECATEICHCGADISTTKVNSKLLRKIDVKVLD